MIHDDIASSVKGECCEMITIHIDKLYRYERKMEPCFIGFPLPKGKLKNTESVRVRSKKNSLPVQVKATSRYDDDSIRFLFLRFLTDIPANRSLTLECDLNGSETACDLLYHPVSVQAVPNGYVLQTASEEGTFSIALENHSDHLFKEITSKRILLN